MKRTGLMIAALGLFLLAQVAQADWTPAKRLSWTLSYSWGQTIAVDSSGSLHVFWYDYWEPSNTEIFYKKSTDGGAAWASKQRITWTTGYSHSPDLAVGPFGYLQLVWSDNTPGNGEVYYGKSTNGGATWPKGQRITWTSGDSNSPAIAVDPSGNLYVVWDDGTPGNVEIYFKKYINSIP